MKTKITRFCSNLALGVTGCLLASCALPPQEAWRVIRKDGLIPYIAYEIKHDHRNPNQEPQSRYIDQAPTTPAPKPAVVNDGKCATCPPVMQTPRLNLQTRGQESARVVIPADNDIPAPAPKKAPAPSAAEVLGSTPKPAPKLAPAAVTEKPKSEPKPQQETKPKEEPKKEIHPAPAPVKPAPAKVETAPVKPSPSKPAPAPAKTEPSTPAPAPAPAKKENGTAAAPAAKPSGETTAIELPYGTPVPGRPGLVNSPYAGKMQLVDVTGLKPGQEVKCPYSGKLFRVPASATATAKQAAEESPKK